MRILRRFLNFIASRMFVLTVVCALLIIAFCLAMNTANIWVLISDGLDAPAGVVLTGEGEEELKLPVLYIGVGEGIEDLQAFDAGAFVDEIL